MKYNEWIKEVVANDLNLNDWEVAQLEDILESDDDDGIEVWEDSAGCYAEIELADGYAIYESEYECMSVYRDAEERYMAEDMLFSVDERELLKSYPDWADLFYELKNKLDEAMLKWA